MASTRVSRSSAPKPPPPPVPTYCICKGIDEKSRPMIACEGGCEDWFHWDCVAIDELGYEDIIDYFCPNCEATTGKQTTRQDLLQSPPDDAFSAVDSPVAELASSSSSAKKKVATKKKSKIESKDEQEHVEEDEEFEPTPSATSPSRKRSNSTSTPSSKAKPPASSSSKPNPARRTSSHSTQPFVPIPSDPKDDPARKTCLDGIRSVLLPLLVNEEKAKAYAQDLEDLVWTAEEGGTTTGRKKYQDRMRSLRFNLSKSDRTELRSGISSGTISPDRLSKMNSHDLANPTSQAAYTAASEASLRLRTIPTSARATPLIVHNHKGVVEVSDSREEMEREEENQRRQEEVERNKRKREREWEGSVQGVLEKVDASEQVKRRRSDVGEAVDETKPDASIHDHVRAHLLSAAVSKTLAASSLVVEENEVEPESVEPDFAMDEFLNDDVLGGDDEEREEEPTAFEEEEPMDLGGGGSPFREVDPEEEVDQAMFDFFVDAPREEMKAEVAGPQVNAVVEGGKVDKGKGKEVVASAEEKAKTMEGEISKGEVLWKGEIINPEVPLHGRLQARQVGGPLVPLDTWSSSLLSKDSYAIIGRVPIQASRKFLLQMHLTPTKELVVVALEGEGEEGKKSQTGLSEFLVKRGRDALIQPHGKADALPTGGARDMYIVVLPSSDPLPEFLEIMDTNRLPAIRAKDYLLAVFIRARSYPTVTSSSRSSKSSKPPHPPTTKSTTPPPHLPPPPPGAARPPPPQLLPAAAAPAGLPPKPTFRPIDPRAQPPPPPPPPEPTPAPIPTTAPLPLFDPSSIGSILANLAGVIPSLTAAASPHHPPAASSHHPSAPLSSSYHLSPPPLHQQHPIAPPTTFGQPQSSHSPYHNQNQNQHAPPPHQQPGSQPYDYPAPPPAGSAWYTPSNNGLPPPVQNGYTPPQQQGYDGRGGGNDHDRERERGGGGRGGERGGWDDAGGGRGGGGASRGVDQGWGRRGGGRGG